MAAVLSAEVDVDVADLAVAFLPSYLTCRSWIDSVGSMIEGFWRADWPELSGAYRG